MQFLNIQLTGDGLFPPLFPFSFSQPSLGSSYCVVTNIYRYLALKKKQNSHILASLAEIILFISANFLVFLALGCGGKSMAKAVRSRRVSFSSSLTILSRPRGVQMGGVRRAVGVANL